MNDGTYDLYNTQIAHFVGLETSIFRSWRNAVYWDTVQTLIYSVIHSICYSLRGIPNFCDDRNSVFLNSAGAWHLFSDASSTIHLWRLSCKNVNRLENQSPRQRSTICNMRYLDSALEINFLHSTKDQQCNRELAIEVYHASWWLVSSMIAT